MSTEYVECAWSEETPEACPFCAGEKCYKCGAGCWSNVTNCQHDSLERHEVPPSFRRARKQATKAEKAEDAMTRNDHLLVILAEESHEISMAAGRIGQAASKALRFGLDDRNPGTEQTNREDLVKEVNDLVAMLEMIQAAGIELPGLFDRAAIDAKKARVEHWLGHSKAKGRLSA